MFRKRPFLGIAIFDHHSMCEKRLLHRKVLKTRTVTPETGDQGKEAATPTAVPEGVVPESGKMAA